MPAPAKTRSKATFRFAWSEKGSTFPLATGKLSVGRHTIAVVAVNAGGVADPTPAKLKFSVIPGPKPGKHGQA